MILKTLLFIVLALPLFANDFDDLSPGDWVTKSEDAELFQFRQLPFKEVFKQNLIDEQALKDALYTQRIQGYKMVDLEVSRNQDDDTLLYHAVFHPGVSNQALALGQDVLTFQATINKCAANGIYLVHMDVIDTEPEALFFGIFEDRVSPRFPLFNLSKKDLSHEYADRFYDQHLFEIVTYETEEGRRYAAAWDQNWAPHYLAINITWQDFLFWKGKPFLQNFRIKDLEGFQSGKHLEYVIVWEESTDAAWSVQTTNRFNTDLQWPSGVHLGNAPDSYSGPISDRPSEESYTLIDYDIVHMTTTSFKPGSSAGKGTVMESGPSGPGT